MAVVLIQGDLISDAAQAMVSVWFLIWALRRKGELDYEFDAPTKRVRWLMVAAGWVILLAGARMRSKSYAWLGFIVATGFLAWPNFAYHVTRLLRRLRFMRASAPDSAPRI
jgi:hypothetical protein